jgi:hypothetical protein
VPRELSRQEINQESMIMAKKATGTTKASAKKSTAASRKPGKAVTATSTGGSRNSGGGSRNSGGDDGGFSEALSKLLQSPLVADLLAVAATAALAALAEHGFSSRGAGANAGGRRAGRAVKEAGKAAAAAIGRRLGNEFEEIRAASKSAKGAAAE